MQGDEHPVVYETILTLLFAAEAGMHFPADCGRAGAAAKAECRSPLRSANAHGPGPTAAPYGSSGKSQSPASGITAVLP
jgi:hypothetical protein